MRTCNTTGGGGQREKVSRVVVVYENGGLNPHIEEVTRRTAFEGFIAFAPFHWGGYNPGFQNDTNPRYDEAASKPAWQRATYFFEEKLS